ncbi:rhomboid family intramembrane serine protease [Dyella sp. EPa41]|uniref:rhomboid family intramembrane serine protease n=1 Tax=Dyella sp. EPa41 TaxID=1561194 RepID=UPI001914FD3A|nr:rhomboid family intramembrane serine protease [Dyella sp. EPa41]
MDWRSEEFLPKANGTWQFWRPPFGRKGNGELRVKRALRQLHLWDPILVASPASARLMPAVCVPEMTHALQKRMALQYQSIFYFSLSVAVASAVFFACSDGTATNILKLTIFSTLFAVFFGMQERLVVSNIDNLRETARFVSWIYMQRTHAVPVAAGFMLLIGLGQYLIENRSGGFELMIIKYGLVYDIAEREPWRYVIGPLFHSGLPHWAGNTALLIMAAGLSAALAKRSSIALIFLLGAILPSYLYGLLPATLHSEAMGGVSGGVFAVFGFAGGIALRNWRWAPPHFGWIVIVFTTILTILSWLANPQSNNFVHVIGLVLGLTLGLVNVGSKIPSRLPT